MLGGNLYAASPDSVWAEKAMDSIGFKVFLTTTLNLGHVHGSDSSESLIFPVLARDEEHDPTSQESMLVLAMVWRMVLCCLNDEKSKLHLSIRPTPMSDRISTSERTLSNRSMPPSLKRT